MPNAVTPLVDIPTTADPANFDARADNFLNVQLPRFVAELNAVATAFTFFTTTATSTTTLTVGLGITELVVDVDKSYLPGMTVKVIADDHPLIWMLGDVISYDSSTGELGLAVQHVLGAGTFGSWTVMLAATEQLDDRYVDRQAIKSAVSALDYFLIADEVDGGKSKKLLIRDILKLTGDVGDIKAITGDYDPVLHADWLVVPIAPTNISRAAYPELWARWGTKYGAGDGTTTFGMYYIPANYSLIQASGGSQGTITVGEVIAHTHDAVRSPGGTGSGPNFQGGTGYVPNYPSGATGGSANLAAGSRVIFLVKYR